MYLLIQQNRKTKKVISKNKKISDIYLENVIPFPQNNWFYNLSLQFGRWWWQF